MRVQILELLEHKAIFTAGYKCILHVHSVVEECECVKLIALDPKTKEKKKVRPPCTCRCLHCGLQLITCCGIATWIILGASSTWHTATSVKHGGS